MIQSFSLRILSIFGHDRKSIATYIYSSSIFPSFEKRDKHFVSKRIKVAIWNWIFNCYWIKHFPSPSNIYIPTDLSKCPFLHETVKKGKKSRDSISWKNQMFRKRFTGSHFTFLFSIITFLSLSFALNPKMILSPFNTLLYHCWCIFNTFTHLTPKYILRIVSIGYNFQIHFHPSTLPPYCCSIGFSSLSFFSYFSWMSMNRNFIGLSGMLINRVTIPISSWWYSIRKFVNSLINNTYVFISDILFPGHERGP